MLYECLSLQICNHTVLKSKRMLILMGHTDINVCRKYLTHGPDRTAWYWKKKMILHYIFFCSKYIAIGKHIDTHSLLFMDRYTDTKCTSGQKVWEFLNKICKLCSSCAIYICNLQFVTSLKCVLKLHCWKINRLIRLILFLQVHHRKTFKFSFSIKQKKL